MKLFFGCIVVACLGATSTLAATFSSSMFAQVTVRSATFVESGENALPNLDYSWFNDDNLQTGFSFFSPNVEGDIFYYPDFFPYPEFGGAITMSSLVGREAVGYGSRFGGTDGLHEWAIAALDTDTPIDLVFDYAIQLSASSTEDSTHVSYVDAEISMNFNGGGDTSNGFVARQADYSGPYFREALNVGFSGGEEGSEVLQKTGTWTHRMVPGEFVGVNTYFTLYGSTSLMPVPLPASLPLLAFGMAGLLLVRRRKR